MYCFPHLTKLRLLWEYLGSMLLKFLSSFVVFLALFAIFLLALASNFFTSPNFAAGNGSSVIISLIAGFLGSVLLAPVYYKYICIFWKIGDYKDSTITYPLPLKILLVISFLGAILYIKSIL